MDFGGNSFGVGTLNRELSALRSRKHDEDEEILNDDLALTLFMDVELFKLQTITSSFRQYDAESLADEIFSWG